MEIDTPNQKKNVDFCGTCLANGTNMKPMTVDTCNKLKNITNLDINSRPIPNWMCFKCERLLNKIDKFKDRCIEANTCIQKFIKNRKKKFDLTSLERNKLINEDLTIYTLPNIDIFPHNDNNTEESFIVLTSQVKCEMPTERREEIDFFFDKSFDSGNIDSDDECENEQIVSKKDIKRKKKCKSKPLFDEPDSIHKISKKPKRRYSKIVIDKMAAKEIRLTEEEQLLEKQQRINDEKYINALFKCEMCIITFRHEYALKNHMEKHSETRGNHVCTYCQQRFGNERYLRAHTATHFIRLICYACGAQLRDKAKLLDHLAWHAGQTFCCNICNGLFMRKASLRNHLRLKHNHFQYKCEFCGKTFSTKDRLKQHELRHSEPLFSCDECGKRFFTVKVLSNHKISHSSERHHYCVECDLYFKSASILKNHLHNTAKHIDPSLLQYSCEHCGKRFRTSLLLKQHVNANHLGSKQFSCEICTASYASRQGLNFHRRLAHQGFQLPKSHQCSRCSKSFTAKALLINHMRVHTGEKPFECSQCHRKFSQKSSLRTHIKLVHLKIKRIIKKKEKKPTDFNNDEKSTVNNQNFEVIPVPVDNIVLSDSQPSYFNEQTHTDQYLYYDMKIRTINCDDKLLPNIDIKK